MNVIRKDARISNTDEEFPGSFEVVLSTPDKDRDGDELAIEDWKQPLPEHITFDMDHGMSVEKTIGSGVPSIEDGKLIVRGTYSSLPRAQEVRTLVKEGHIRTTSVAFATEKVTKDGRSHRVRELLNGAFVAVPANPNARVLSAKAGARHNAVDQAHVQAIYDHVVALGAGPMDDTGADEDTIGGKAAKPDFKPLAAGTHVTWHYRGAIGHGTITGVHKLGTSHDTTEYSIAEHDHHVSDTGSHEKPTVYHYGSALTVVSGGKSLADLQARLGLKAKYDAQTLRQMLDKGEAMANASGDPSYPIGDKEDLSNAIHAVGRGQGDHDKIRAYIIRRAKDLGASDEIPDDWNSDGSVKALDDVETKAATQDSMISISMNGYAGGFNISVDAWCVPGEDSDAYADTAQRVLAAALAVAAAGPVDDDNDEEGTAVDSATPAGDVAKSADAEYLELEALALKVIADSYTD